MNDQDNKSIRDKVAEAINTGKVEMKSHTYFTVRTLLTISLALGVGLLILILSSLIFFLLRESGVWYAPGFGLRGTWIFLRTFPWLVLLLTAVFIFALELILKKYSFTYHRPLLYSAVAVVVLAGLGGFALSVTHVHNYIYEQSEAGHVPLVSGEFYRDRIIPQHEELTSGTVESLDQDSFDLLDLRGVRWEIRVDMDTLGFKRDFFDVGDEVVVLGPRGDGYIDAVGVKKVKKGFMLMVPLRDRPMPRKGSLIDVK